MVNHKKKFSRLRRERGTEGREHGSATEEKVLEPRGFGTPRTERFLVVSYEPTPPESRPTFAKERIGRREGRSLSSSDSLHEGEDTNAS